MHKFVTSIIQREFRENLAYIIFYTLVIALLISAFVSLVSVMAFMPNQFMAHYTYTAGIVDARIKGDNETIDKSLDENTIVYYEKDGVTYNVDISSSSSSLHLLDYLSGRCFDFSRDSSFFIEPKLLDGDIPKTGETMLARELATYLGVKLGDTVNIGSARYKVSGIYDLRAVPFKTSFIAYEDIMNMTGGDMHIIVNVNNNTPYMYVRFQRKGIYVEDDYGYIGLYSSLVSIMLVLGLCTLIIGVSSIIIYINLIKYMMLKRQKIMYMFIALGADKRQVLNVYIGIFSIISLIGNIIGLLGGYGLVTYFRHLFTTIIGITEHIVFLWYVPIIVCVLLVGIAVIVTTLFLKGKSIRKGLSEVEI